MKDIELSAGTIRYRDSGSGPTIVFVHGALVDGALWRKVVPLLQDRYRCIVPDLPLGSHTIPMKPSADLTPPGLARLIGEFLEKLDLRDVTLVANDTGGALTQILLASGKTDRIGRVVLTPCDAFDNFLPQMFRPLQLLARVPGAVYPIAQSLRVPALRRLPFAFGWLTKRRIPNEVTAAWVRPGQTDKGIRRDIARFLAAIDKRYTLEAAEKLSGFDRPVLIAWAPEDRFFPREHADRLAEILPDARIEEVPDSYTFVSEDQPELVARLVGDFALGSLEASAASTNASTTTGAPGSRASRSSS
jgi:pimeloyl-ACP methyl ester carboxylesterase